MSKPTQRKMRKSLDLAEATRCYLDEYLPDLVFTDKQYKQLLDCLYDNVAGDLDDAIELSLDETVPPERVRGM